MRLPVGKFYHLRYMDWHVDPYPYLFVTYSDSKYTEGFNIHYFPQIRFKLPIEKYRTVSKSVWENTFDTMTKNGRFKLFLDELYRIEAMDRDAKTQMKRLTMWAQNKHSWSMLAYRKYHSNKLRLVR